METAYHRGFGVTLARQAIRAVVVSGMLAMTHGSPVLAKDVAPIDACALLDARVIQDVIAVPVEKGDRRDSGLESNGAYSSSCVWMVTADRSRATDPQAPLGGKRFVILNVLRWPDGAEGARSYLQAFREASDSGVIPSKPDARQFGDEALWWGDGLAVRKSDVSFGVSIFMPRASNEASSARAGEREEKLAKVILARLASQTAAAK
jgi:hypothetical protein